MGSKLQIYVAKYLQARNERERASAAGAESFLDRSEEAFLEGVGLP